MSKKRRQFFFRKK